MTSGVVSSQLVFLASHKLHSSFKSSSIAAGKGVEEGFA